MYSVYDFGAMIADKVRTEAYAEALRRAVRPGAVVLDIGTGTGIWALLACRAGARRVYAVEPNEAILVAREIAAANGVADRVEFIQELSTRIDLPERADVIVSDLRGRLPVAGQHLPSIIDARRRFLKPGGTMIPRRDTLWAAVVDAPSIYEQYVAPWRGNGFRLDMGAAVRFTTNGVYRQSVTSEQLLTEPCCWAALDYLTLDAPPVRGEACWSVPRAGSGHGLCVWFDATLADGVSFSNAPGEPEVIYGHVLFPWPAPVPLEAGDTVSVTFQADPVGEEIIWRWATSVRGRDPAAPPKANFRQSTFHAEPLSQARLAKWSAGHVPALNEDGQIDRAILSLMDGGTPAGEIAQRLGTDFPRRFARWEDALTRVGKLSARYSR
jgi:protein arginine N-methyltransferase 1